MQTHIEVEPVEGRSLPLEMMTSRRVNRRMNVPNTAYYRRAIRRGDIKRAEPEKAKRAAKSTGAKKAAAED